MKISHKLILALAAVSLPLALVSVGLTFYIQHQLVEVGAFHSPNLSLIQTIASEALAAVEESFAYIASGEKRQKEHFSRWAAGFTARMAEFESAARIERRTESVELELGLARMILSDQRTMVEYAEAMFRQFEAEGKLSRTVFGRYEEAVNRLRADMDELIRHEKAEMDEAHATALQIIKQSQAANISLAALSAGLAILAGWFMSRAISGPLAELKSASVEISRGNFDVTIASTSKDEIGDLARSISGMAQDLKGRQQEVQLRYQELQALAEIDRAIMSTLDLRIVLNVLLRKIDLILPNSATAIRLFNKETRALEPVACWNLDEKEWKAEAWSGGRGIPNLVFETRSAKTIRNVQDDPNIRDPEFFRRHGLVSFLGIPLITQDDILGVISFYSKSEHEFSRDEIDFLTTLAGQAAIAILNSQLYEGAVRKQDQLKEAYQHLEAIFKLTVATSESLDLEATLREAIRQLTEVFDFDASEIFILNRQTGSLEMKASFGSPLTRVRRSFRLGEGIIGRVAAAKSEAVVFEDVLNDARYQEWSETRIAGAQAFRFFAAFPIRNKRRTVGALACIGRSPRTLTPNEFQALNSITAQLGIAIENATLYQQAVQRNEELEKALNVKEEFLSVMSHELRTPMSVIMGYVGMIADGMLGEINEKQKNTLQKTLRRARDQVNMVDAILQATQLESQEVAAQRAELNVADFLDDLKTSYRMRMTKNPPLYWDYGPDLPSITTDGAKLEQILRNLIDNAIKFTRMGSVTVSARATETENPELETMSARQSQIHNSSGVEFKVSDTGSGIPKERLPLIFEKFYQVDSSETRLYGGVGLGLYIVKKFTDLLGGKVEVESEPGKGTTFTVTIPALISGGLRP
jgi:signal transduction histidine kinase/HAMP domain-containing protein